MKIPTAAELSSAQATIRGRGPGAKETMELSKLAARDPTLRDTLDRQVDVAMTLFPLADRSADTALIVRALLTGIFVTGLDFGLTVER